ncbi:hypothetical protein T440DRAFT_516717 [Plenodomus tracheiphilus IPT5]|uniref:Uncharacterized protein n=1 Tax=Plenodomus tracheiphilus IPT5 TaxID=1408161 RepID=A0A6A7BAM9_9PLEO|nr:hypothetical protein T440DRAFT_516717 [Plenodomus tracheiphilus IPT5]
MGNPKLHANPPSKPPKSRKKITFLTRLTSLFRTKKPATTSASDSDSDLYKGDVEINDTAAQAPMRMLSPRSTDCVPATPQRKTRTISFGLSPKKVGKSGAKDGGAKGNVVAVGITGKVMGREGGVETEGGLGADGEGGVETEGGLGAVVEGPAKVESGNGGRDNAVGQTCTESPAVESLRRVSQPCISSMPASPGKDAALRSHPVAGAEGSDSSDGGVYATPVSEMSSAKGRPITM